MLRRFSRTATTLLILLAFSTGPFLGIVGSQGTTPSAPKPVLVVKDADLAANITEVFGFGDANVVLEDKTFDTTPQRDFVKGVSASGPGGSLTFDMTETGPETGEFLGTFGFAGDATLAGDTHPFLGKVLGNGRLKVSPGDEITVLSTSPDATTKFRWFPAANGTFAQYEDPGHAVAQGPTILGWGDVVYYSVTDTDLNRDSTRLETYSGLLRVRSDSDLKGESFELVESAANTGVFFASVGFEASPHDGNHLVFTQNGDRVYAEYFDLHGADGVALLMELASRLFVGASDGFVGFQLKSYAGLTAVDSGGIDRATLFVVDSDRDVAIGSEPVFVNITRDGTPVCSNVRLFQLGGVQGAYYVTLGFTSVVASQPSCPSANSTTGIVYLPVTAGPGALHVFTAQYNDPRDATGVPRNLTASAQWVPGASGSLVIGPSVTAPIAKLTGNSQNVQLALTDPDANRDPVLPDRITVVVKSTSNPHTGVEAVLEETTETSGFFLGSFEIGPANTTTSLQVRDRDTIQAFYDDPLAAGGLPARVASQSVVWRAPSDATIQTDNSDYFHNLNRKFSLSFCPQTSTAPNDIDAACTFTVDTTPDDVLNQRTDAFFQFRDFNAGARGANDDRDAMDGCPRGPGEQEGRKAASMASNGAPPAPDTDCDIRDRVVIDADGTLGQDPTVTVLMSVLSNPLKITNAAGADTVAANDLATLIIDTSLDGTFAITNDAFFQFRNPAGAVAGIDPTRDRIVVDTDGTQGPAPTRTYFLAPGPATMARVYVQDNDQNDPRVTDHVTAQARTDPGDGGTASVASLVLDEVGPDSGLFTGTVMFTTGAANASRLNLGSVQSQPFHFEYVDAGGLGLLSSATLTWHRPTSLTAQRFLRLEFEGATSFHPRDLIPIQPQDRGHSVARIRYAVVLYGPPGLANPQIQVFSSRCADPVIYNLADEGAGGLADGRYVASVPFRATSEGDSCIQDGPGIIADPLGDLDFPEVGEVAVAQTGGTITVKMDGAADLVVQTRAIATPATTLLDTAGKELAEGLDGIGQVAKKVGLAAPDDDFMAGFRDTSFLDATSRTGGAISVPVVETGLKTDAFVGGFVEKEGVARSNPREGQVRAQSDLVGGWGFVPAARLDQALFPRVVDGVTVGPKCSFPSGATSCDSYQWYDASTARLQVTKGAVGDQGFFEVTISGDDPISNRVLREEHTRTAMGQLTYDLAQPLVARSELVYDNRSEMIPTSNPTNPTGATATIYYTVEAATHAAEPISDRNRDGVVDCRDLVFGLRAPGTVLAASFRCLAVDPVAGLIKWTCAANRQEDCPKTVDYEYRLADNSTASDIFSYQRVGSQRIRIGDEIAEDNKFYLDYTPALQPLTVRSAAGETEAVTATWDTAAALYRAQVPVEVKKILKNGAILVSGETTMVEFRFADPRMSDGAPSSTDPLHLRAIIAQAPWRTGKTGVVEFRTPDFSTPITETAYGPAVPVQLVDPDADVTFQQDSVLVTASDQNNPALATTAILRETSSQSGVFRGFVPIGGPLNLASGAKLVVRYNDRFASDSQPKSIAQLITWAPSQTGVVQVFQDSARTVPLTGGLVVGAETAAYMKLTDPDANLRPEVQDDLLVRVVSTSDPVGELVTFSETGANEGVFINNQGIRFEGKLIPDDGRVFARDNAFARDNITVLYVDPIDAAGRQRIVRSSPIRWDQTFDAVVNVEARQYVGTLANFTAGAAGIRALAIVTVADGDCNLRPDLVDIIVATGHGNCPPIANFTLASLSSVGSPQGPVTLTQLVETGPNTGVFMAQFTFTSGPSEQATGETATDRAKLLVNNQQRFRASYRDPHPAAGTAGRTFLDEATWFGAGFGLLEFDRPGYNSYEDRPELRLIDGDLRPGAVNLTVTSQSDTLGINVQLNQTAPGFYEASFGLTSGDSGPGRIKVAFNDQLTVQYQDLSPPGTRTATAEIGIGNVTAPTTRIVTVPAPQGIRGFGFKQPVNVSFQANKPIQDTIYRVGLTGTNQSFLAPIVFTDEGAYDVFYHSIDVYGNVEAEKHDVVVVDFNPPKSSISALKGRPSVAGSVNLTWTAPSAKGDYLEAYDYTIYRDDGTTPVGNSSSETFVDRTVSDENPHTYRGAVRDYVGFEGPKSSRVTVTPDATLPLLSDPTVDPTTFDVRDPPADGVFLGVHASDLHLSGVRAALAVPNGTRLVQVDLANSDQDLFEGYLDVSALADPCSCTLIFEAFDEAGNRAEIRQVYIVRGIDLLSPSIETDLPSNGRVTAGSRINVHVSDNLALSAASWRYDTFDLVNVAIDPLSPGNFTFTVPAGVVVGNHTIEIRALDVAAEDDGTPAPNEAVRVLNFTTLAPPGKPGVTSYFLFTTATPAKGGILVKWNLTAGLDPAELGGFQVWRSSSPWALLSTVSEPGARSYLDTTAEGGKSYKYVVTFFTKDGLGRVNSLADLPGYPGDTKVPGTQATKSQAPGGLPAWVWWVLVAIAVVVAAALIPIVLAARRGGGKPTESSAEEGRTGEPPQQRT